jgi:hypothetical protein
MRHRCCLARVAVTLAVFLALTASSAYAGGPIAPCRPGEAYRWPNGGTNIPWNPDRGSLGPLDNAQAVSVLAAAFAAWHGPTTSTSYSQGIALAEDVDITNYARYLTPTAPDNQSAIVFDHSGEIFEELFGPDSGILGFAGPEWVDPDACTIVEGLAFLNGASFASQQEALDVMVHELGHFQGLGHTIVNGQILFGDHSGPSPFNTFPVGSLGGRIETMYPFYFGPLSGFSTPDRDDVSALSTLYPSPTFFATSGTITGRIFAPDRYTLLSGFNVIARNVENPLGDAVSGLSGAYATDLSPGSPSTGAYVLNGLTPGARYAVFVDAVQYGSFSLPPGELPAPEEFYSGNRERKRSSKDDPARYRAVKVRAGAISDDVDIIFNGGDR